MSETLWRLRTFGGIEVARNGHNAKFRTKKTLALVARLALRPGETFDRDQLARSLWPEVEVPRQSLRMALTDIRSVLGETAVRADQNSVSLNPDVISSDATEFEAAVRLGRPGDALNLVNGPLLPGFDDDWVLPEWLRMQEAIAAATVALMEKSPSDEALAVGKRMLAILGCREDIHIALMKLYVSKGLTSLAIAQFEELERQLDETWGEPPSQAAINVLESAPRVSRSKTRFLRPAERHRLIGRDELLTSLVAALESHLGTGPITLIGPGGSGKTSLAKAAVEELAERSGGFSWFADLSTERTLEGAVRKVQTVLGLPHAEQSEALPAIARFLRAKPGILVLDNFEQLVGVANPLVENLSKLGKECQLLITSRVSLQTEGETLVNVGPLPLPGKGTNLDFIRANPAVALFERQASLANESFSINTNNVLSVVELCRRLDGLPLALELAAARVIIHSPAQILASIHGSLEAIDSRTSNAPQRHRGLESTIRWSIDLLDEKTKEVCLAASVFAGSFTEADLRAITDREVAPSLETLVQASIVIVDANADVARYRMLETIRDSVRAMLERLPLYAVTMPRFILHMSQVAKDVEMPGQFRYDQRMQKHLDQWTNYSAALDYCVAHRVEPKAGAELAIAINRTASVYGQSGPLSAAMLAMRRWPKSVLSKPIRALVVEGWLSLLHNVGDIPQQIALAKPFTEERGLPPSTEARLRMALASLYKGGGMYDEAFEELLKVMELFDEITTTEQARTNYNAGLVICCIGDHERSLQYHLEALRLGRKGDDRNLLIRILFDVGSELAHQGRFDESLEIFDEAIEHCTILDSKKLEGLTRWQQGDAFLWMDRPREALEALRLSIDLVEEAGFRAGLQWIYLKTSEALAKCGDAVLAVKVLGKAVESRNSNGRPLAVYEQNDFDKLSAFLHEAMSEMQFQRYWAEGAQMEWNELTDLIHRSPVTL